MGKLNRRRARERLEFEEDLEEQRRHASIIAEIQEAIATVVTDNAIREQAEHEKRERLLERQYEEQLARLWRVSPSLVPVEERVRMWKKYSLHDN